MDLIGLGGDPALEFVNTSASPGGGQTVELIGSGPEYVDWLSRVPLLGHPDLASARAAFSVTELDAVAEEGRDLREWLRPVIADWATADGHRVPDAARRRLNSVLELESRFARVDLNPGHPYVSDVRRWTSPRQLLVPPVAAASTLFATGNRDLIRKCEGCVLWFYDHTKAHRRRWCSMALCGNREKARRHRERWAGSPDPGA